jgi:Cys-Gly metallodipeptidase DUG1
VIPTVAAQMPLPLRRIATSLTDQTLHKLYKGYPQSVIKRKCWESQLIYPKTNHTYAHRSFYGNISDQKMAPQLEPFFTQYVCAPWNFVEYFID